MKGCCRMKYYVVLFFSLALLGGFHWEMPRAFAETPAGPSKKKDQYRCSMHPQVRSDHPGTCPICQMRLERVRSAPVRGPETQASPTQKNSANGKSEGKPSGDRKIKYYRHPMDPSIHSDVPAKDSMGMDYIPIYEPTDKQAKGGSFDERTSFDLTPEQFRLTGTRVVTLEPKDVIQELRVPGRALGGERVSFQIFEQDLAHVKPGLVFEAEAPALAGETLRGKITAIESILDPMTRTARVNGVLNSSPKTPLRSEASLSGRIQIRLSKVLAVPETAVLYTGTRDLLFVTDGNGGFSPRVVTLGVKAQGFYEIKSGAKAGEKVSAGPNFLLDSESKIQFTYDSENH